MEEIEIPSMVPGSQTRGIARNVETFALLCFDDFEIVPAFKRSLIFDGGQLNMAVHKGLGSLVAYTSADWVGCPTTRRSTSGYCVFLGDNLLLWSAKRQHTLSRSSAEAEYRGVANVVAKTAWLRNLLRELPPLSIVTMLVRVLHVPSRYQYADIFTNGLLCALFEEFRTSLSVRLSPAQTAGGVLDYSLYKPMGFS
ncbi:ribonuclease H-like domain-containing protein [Tanacetum coccineum]